MRPIVRDFVAAVARELPLGEPIVEFGAFQVPGQEEIADLRPLFPGLEYVGVDMRPGRGVDRLLDLHDITLPDGYAAVALCLETLEHVERPQRAVEEICRVLRPGGWAAFSSTMCFPIHEHPGDYWRFTPGGLRSLLRPFPNVWVGWAGRDDFPHTVIGLGFKGPAPDLSGLLRWYQPWRRRPDVAGVRRWERWANAWLPPALWQTAVRVAARRRRPAG